MKKILSVILIVALTLSMGIYSFAESKPEEVEPENLVITTEKPVEVEEVESIEESVEEMQEEAENHDNEDTEPADDTIEVEEEILEEEHCWFYDLTEENGTVTYFRICEECGRNETLKEQNFYDLGGQWENCEKGRHNFYNGHCELCGQEE